MKMPHETDVLKGKNLLPLFEELKDQIAQAVQGGTALHEVEKVIWQQVLRIGREALGQFLALLGNGDLGETIELPDGRCCQRLDQEHSRRYLSIFGEFVLSRVVYGSREGQKIEFVPLDNRLQLPAGVFSYLLQDWDQSLCVEQAFGQASVTIQRMLGLKQSVDSLEHMNQEMRAFAAEHHVPFAIDEVFLDFQSVGKHDGVLDLILVAVKKSKVLEYAAVVEDAGLVPSIVDVDSFALGNQFEVNYPGERGETVALIDIGASIMKTNVVRSGSTIFARDIPFGGNNYTQAIAQQLKIPFEQAEAAKLGRDVGVRWETVVPALEAVSRELSLEIQRTFDYFASTAESERIGKIVLAGGCAQLPGLGDYLSSNWGIPVELTKPFQRIDFDPAYADDVHAAGPALAVAVGLALRRPGDKQK